MRPQKVAVLLILFAFPISLTASAKETLNQEATTTNQAAQQKNEYAVVNGRAFLITEAGDLKPARLDKVLLLYHHSDKDDQAVKSGETKTAGSVFKDASLKKRPLEVQAEKSISQIGSPQYNKIMRESYDLAVSMRFTDAIVAAQQWAKSNAPDQILEQETDEEGNFQVSTKRAGNYLLIVEGRAGFNEAVWLQELDLAIGQTVSVKLAKPISSYMPERR